MRHINCVPGAGIAEVCMFHTRIDESYARLCDFCISDIDPTSSRCFRTVKNMAMRIVHSPKTTPVTAPITPADAASSFKCLVPVASEGIGLSAGSIFGCPFSIPLCFTNLMALRRGFGLWQVNKRVCWAVSTLFPTIYKSNRRICPDIGSPSSRSSTRASRISANGLEIRLNNSCTGPMAFQHSFPPNCCTWCQFERCGSGHCCAFFSLKSPSFVLRLVGEFALFCSLTGVVVNRWSTPEVWNAVISNRFGAFGMYPSDYFSVDLSGRFCGLGSCCSSASNLSSAVSLILRRSNVVLVLFFLLGSVRVSQNPKTP